jgi:mono/diheme cytochrome c family protein
VVASRAVILALSGGQKTALLIMAGIFIAFALASSFLFPRRDPDYPGRRLRLFVVAAVVLTIAMLTSMFVFAKESEEAGAAEHEPAATEPAPGTTAGGGETTTGGGEQGGEQGDAAAGKEVFASAGCTGCHTLADAGATGNVGPNLDEAKPPHELVVDRVTNGAGPMPSFKGQLSEKQIQDVAAYVSSVAGQG